MRMVGGPDLNGKIAYVFGAESVEVRVNRWTREIRAAAARRVRCRPCREPASGRDCRHIRFESIPSQAALEGWRDRGL
jgi:hypothetical protein